MAKKVLTMNANSMLAYKLYFETLVMASQKIITAKHIHYLSNQISCRSQMNKYPLEV
jgi:hypothetical protein